MATYASLAKAIDDRCIAGRSTNRFASNFWLSGVNLSALACSPNDRGVLVAPNAILYAAHFGASAATFAIDAAGTKRITRNVIGIERINVTSTPDIDDLCLAKLDANVDGAVPMPIVEKWSFANLADLPVCFDRQGDTGVFVQEVRTYSNVVTKPNKIMRFCDVANQTKRVPFTSKVGQDSSQTAFVVDGNRACLVGPLAWGWGGSSFPWPNFGYIDLTFYAPAIRTAADKLGVKPTFITIN